MYSYNNTVIVDVQFVVSLNKEYTIKELAILPAAQPTPFYFLFKPPYPFRNLDRRAKYQNLYNCRFVNGLDWDFGIEDYSSIKQVLKTYQNCTIIVKGCEKKTALQKLLPLCNIVDLQAVSRLEDLPNFKHNCPYHAESFQRCVVNNVYKIRRCMDNKNLFN